MPHYDSRLAARERDLGMAKITSITWRAGAAGVAVAGLLTFALGHHPEASGGGSQHHQPGSILIPAQPPKPVAGSGQVISGAS
jgi:hypothetical protein